MAWAQHNITFPQQEENASWFENVERLYEVHMSGTFCLEKSLTKQEILFYCHVVYKLKGSWLSDYYQSPLLIFENLWAIHHVSV